MRANFVHKLTLLAAVFSCPTVWANQQQAMPENSSIKAEDVEQASIPQQKIVIDGKELVLNLRTLANLQRESQERAFAEKLERILSAAPAGVVKAGSQKVESAKAEPAPQLANKPVTAVKPDNGASATPAPETSTEKAPKIVSGTLLSVYGPANELIAEVYADKGRVLTLQAGQRYQGWKIQSIDYAGLTVQQAGKSRQWLLGESLR